MQKSYQRKYEEQLGKLLRAVKAEAAELAVKFGFARGPLLRQAVLDELEWWNENGLGHEDPLALDLDSDTPELIRATCLSALDFGLAPEGGKSVGPAETWFEMIDEQMEVLRHAVRKAARPPSSEALTAWSKTRAARARVAELKREIEETEQAAPAKSMWRHEIYMVGPGVSVRCP